VKTIVGKKNRQARPVRATPDAIGDDLRPRHQLSLGGRSTDPPTRWERGVFNILASREFDVTCCGLAHPRGHGVAPRKGKLQRQESPSCRQAARELARMAATGDYTIADSPRAVTAPPRPRYRDLQRAPVADKAGNQRGRYLDTPGTPPPERLPGHGRHRYWP